MINLVVNVEVILYNTTRMKNVICFDLEGPLSPQDNAYEVMGLIPEGYKIFEVISRYDDILTLEGRENYEPGDTLSLIVPFLLYHKITERDIRSISDKARIVDGVPYVVSRLKELNWDSYIISTSYEQHAFNIADKIGIPRERTYCTSLKLDKFREEFGGLDFSLIEKAEHDILNELYPSLDDEKRIKRRLNKFFWEALPKTTIGNFIKEVEVVGGGRKVNALYKISEKTGKNLSEIIAVGDSITDFRMLSEVKSNGGISVVFNGNKYAVPYGDVGLASPDMRFLLVIISAYMRGGKEGVLNAVKDWEKNHDEFIKNPGKIPGSLIPGDVRNFLKEKSSDKNFIHPYFHYLDGITEEKQRRVVKIHSQVRSFVRGEAAKLG